MPKPAKYLARGNLKTCLDYMFTHWTASNEEYLSIIHHIRGNYYAVVNDIFLDNDLNVPEVEGSRVMLRTTLTELKTLCTYYHASQMQLPI